MMGIIIIISSVSDWTDDRLMQLILYLFHWSVVVLAVLNLTNSIWHNTLFKIFQFLSLDTWVKPKLWTKILVINVTQGGQYGV